jgi:hypothetical protein
MEAGEMIQCRDFEDLIRTMGDLLSQGVETDYSFSDAGGSYVLEVVRDGRKETAGSQGQA